MTFLSNVIFVRLAFYADADPDPAILVQKFMVVIMSCCLKEVYTHSPYRGHLPPKWLTLGKSYFTVPLPDEQDFLLHTNTQQALLLKI
jgi:hypothetical protein